MTYVAQRYYLQYICVDCDFLNQDGDFSRSILNNYRHQLPLSTFNLFSLQIFAAFSLFMIILSLITSRLIHFATMGIFSEAKSLVAITSGEKSGKNDPKRPIFSTYEFNALYSKLKNSIEDQKKIAFKDALIETHRRIAHDIRSPALRIKLSLENDGLTKDNVKNFIVDQSNYLVEMADAIMKVKKDSIASSPFYSRRTVGNLRSMVKAAVSDAQYAFEKQGIKIIFENRSVFSSYPCQTSQIEINRLVGNLINNAVQAMTHSSQGDMIRVGLRRDDMYAIISISDNGPGVPEDIADQLFIKQVSTGKKLGYGIGLLSCRDICQDLGGSIELCRELNHTTFEIKLPLKEAGPFWLDQLNINSHRRFAYIGENGILENKIRAMKEMADLEVFHSHTDFFKQDKPDLVSYTLFLDRNSKIDREFFDNITSSSQLDCIANMIYISDDEMLPSDRQNNRNINIYQIPESRLNELEIARIDIPMHGETKLVYLDDCDFFRTHFQLHTDAEDYKISIYKNVNELFHEIQKFGRDCYFLLDNYLKEAGVEGLHVGRYLYDLGYKNIFLYSNSDIDIDGGKHYWIKDKIKKGSESELLRFLGLLKS